MAYSVNDVQAYLQKLEHARLVKENDARQEKLKGLFDEKQKKDFENEQKLFVDVVRGVETVSPKAFGFLIKDVPTSNSVAGYYNDILELGAIVASPPPINWFGLAGKFVGIISKLFSGQPSAGISDAQRLIVIENNVNALLLSTANDYKQFRIDKLTEAIALYKIVNTRVSNVYKAHPNLSGELYPWKNGGDETEESLWVRMRTLLTEVFGTNSRVWKSKFFPQDWDPNVVEWKYYIADLVPYLEKTARPPRNLDDVFDGRVTIDYFIEYVGLMLTLFSLRTPQYRSLGIYKKDILEMVEILDFVISEYKKIYYFDTSPDAKWTGGTVAGGGSRIFESNANPPNQWNIVAGQSGPCIGAVHPGMGVGIVKVLGAYYDYIQKMPRIPSNVEIKDNVYVDEFSREQLEIIMGVPVYEALRTTLFELAQTPYKSETVKKTNTIFWNDLWEIQPSDIKIEVTGGDTYYCHPILRHAVQWHDFSIALQRADDNFTDIPSINYSFFIKSNSNGERIALHLGSQTFPIETKVMNTILVSQSNYNDIAENLYQYANKFSTMHPQPVMETKIVSITCHLSTSPSGNYQLRISTELPNINAICSFIILEDLPIGNISLETESDILLVGNGILVPQELIDTLENLQIAEAISHVKFARQVAPFKNKTDFLKDSFTNPVEDPESNIPNYLTPAEFKSINAILSKSQIIPKQNIRVN